MSLTSNDSGGFYSRMSRLELKLKESEQERLELEDKFNRLLNTSKSKQTMQLQRLRNNYRQLLEQDRLRCERNDTILRTLNRVEGRASALTAKTDRLRLLKHHFETNLSNIYQDKKRVSEEKYATPRNSVVDIHSQSLFIERISHSPKPVNATPPIYFPRTPTLSRRSSLVIPDSEIELSKYKFSGGLSGCLFEDSLKSKLPNNDILSVESETDYTTDPKIVEDDLFNTQPTYTKQNIDGNRLQTLTSYTNTSSLQKNSENYSSHNLGSVKRSSLLKKYEHPSRSDISESTLIVRSSPSKSVQTKPLTRSSTFSTMQKPSVYLPSERPLSRRLSFSSHRSISPQPSNKSYSPLASTLSHQAYNRSKSPLAVVDDIFKKYLINYDKRYLSDPISESKYGKYLYPSKSYENLAFRNQSDIVYRSPNINQNCFEHATINRYLHSTMPTNKLPDRYNRYGSVESLYSGSPLYQPPDNPTYSSRSSHFRNDWKEWDHFRDRYHYAPRTEASSIKNSGDYLDDLTNQNDSESRSEKGFKQSLSYDFDDDSMKKKAYSIKENNNLPISNIISRPSKLTDLDMPDSSIYYDSDDPANLKNYLDSDHKSKDKLLKMPQTPKRVSFSKKFLYNEKSDAGINLSSEEEGNTTLLSNHPTSLKDYYQTGSDSIMIPTFSDDGVKYTDESVKPHNMYRTGDIENLEGAATNLETDKNIPNIELFKSRAKRRASLFSKDSLNDGTIPEATSMVEQVDPNKLHEVQNSTNFSHNFDELPSIQKEKEYRGESNTENNDLKRDKNIPRDEVLSRPSNVISVDNKSVFSAMNTATKSETDEVDVNKTNLKITDYSDKKELSSIKQSDKIARDKFDKNKNYDSNPQEPSEIKEENPVDYKTFPEDSKNKSYSSGILSGDKPAPVLEDGNVYDDKILPVSHKPTHDVFPDPQEYQKKPDTYDAEYNQQPVDYSESSYRPVDDQDYQQTLPEQYQGNEYIQQDSYGQGYVEGRDHFSPNHYQEHPAVDDYSTSTTQLENNYPLEYSQQPVQYEGVYEEPQQGGIQEQYVGDYDASYEQNPQYEYSQQANVPEQYAQVYQTQQVSDQYDKQYHGQSDIQTTDRYDEQIQHQQDQRITAQYDENYQNQSNEYIADIPQQYDQQYQNQHDQHVTEQYQGQSDQYDIQATDQYDQQYQNQPDDQITDQYQGQSDQYDIQATDQYDQQYQNQPDDQITDQYQGQSDQYDIQATDQYDQQYQNQQDDQITDQYQSQSDQYDIQATDQQYDQQYHNQAITEEYDGQYKNQTNQYSNQENQYETKDEYDQQYQGHYDQQQEQYDPQYHGQPVQYEGQELGAYNEEYQTQPDQYASQRLDDYGRQHPDQIPEQYKEEYQAQPDNYEQYSGYDQQPQQYDQSYQGEPVQYGYDGDGQQSVHEQQSYPHDSQYGGVEGMDQDQNQSHGDSDYVTQENVPANIPVQDNVPSMPPNPNKDSASTDFNDQPAPTLKPNTSTQPQVKAASNLNRVLE